MLDMRKVLIAFTAFLLLSSCSPRPWTKQEKIAAGYFCVAHFADYYTTNKMLNNPANWETNPILGEHPSNSETTFYFSITGIGALVVGHFWPDARQPLFLGYGTLNAGMAAYNTRLY